MSHSHPRHPQHPQNPQPFTRRAILRGGLTATAVGALGLTGTLPAGAAPGLLVPTPTIYGTSAWGARPNSSPITVLSSRPVKIIVHHTATENSNDFSQAHAYSLSRGIQNWHMDHNGWLDTGQHFTNSRGGWLTEGRHRSLEVLRGGTRHVQSAHTSGQNDVALGIENEGTYLTVGPTSAQWRSLVALCAYMCQQYRISPNSIYGHRDYNNTQCPGDVLYSRLPQLRREVAAALGSTAPVVDPVSWPLLELGDTGEKVLAAQYLLRSRGEAVPADGVFGPSTDEAVRRVEVAGGLTSDGLVGAETWPLLVPVLRRGDTGAAVQAVQLLLATHGQPGERSRSGSFGAETESAVRGFQTGSQLPASGLVDEQTWLRLLA